MQLTQDKMISIDDTEEIVGKVDSASDPSTGITFNQKENESKSKDLILGFVSMVSHEFRSPLTIIQSSAEILEKFNGKLSKEEKSKHFQKVYDSIFCLSDLLDDVIMYCRADIEAIKPKYEEIEIISHSKQAIEKIKTSFPVSSQINFHPEVKELNVFSDKKLYSQILSNLVSNALKYTPTDKAVEISISLIKGKFVLKVQDNGIGIPREALDKIFKPFARASNTANIPGTGLGLAIIKQSVNLLAGSIQLNSEINKGSTFKVFLPLNIHTR